MTRVLSATYRDAASRAETDEAPIILLTIEHASISPALRLCNNGEDIISRGETYSAFPFEIELPDDAEGKVPGAKLQIHNADKRVIEAMRLIEGSPTVTLEVILASLPNVVEASFPEMELNGVDWDSFTLTGVLTLDALIGEPYPSIRFTPSNASGIF